MGAISRMFHLRYRVSALLSNSRTAAPRLDLCPLVPLSCVEGDIEAIRSARRVAHDVTMFKIKGTMRTIAWSADSSCDHRPGCRRFVDGDAGAYLGAGMSGGKIKVKGNAGALTGGSMIGGEIDIGGNSGERTGGVADGESLGMRGGRIVIGGNVGDVVGHRMRRGTIIVGGNAGEYAAAGWSPHHHDRRQGRASRRLWLAPRHADPRQAAKQLRPSATRQADFNIRLLGAVDSRCISAAVSRRRLMGDMAVLGKGEMLILPDLSPRNQPPLFQDGLCSGRKLGPSVFRHDRHAVHPPDDSLSQGGASSYRRPSASSSRGSSEVDWPRHRNWIG
jgi:formylmethanofuran dehydrogenase subunit C